MHLSRRIAALLAVALLAGAPAVAHAQGSAGDDQYQDPFGGSTSGGKKSGGSKGSGSGSSTSGSSTGSSSTGSSGTTGSSGSTSSGTTAAPATSSSTTGSSSATESAPAPVATSTGARQELPRTGLDAPVIALLGIGLLAAGVGLRLRLRTVDGRR